MLLGGDMEQAAGEHSVTVKKAGVRVSSKDRRHAIDFGAEGGRCLVLHVADASMMAGFENSASAGDFFTHDEKVVRALAEASHQLADITAAPLLDLKVKEALNRLRLLGSGCLEAPPPWLEETRMRLESSDKPVSIASLADAAGVRREHFSRRFRHYFGYAPSEYSSAQRLAKALRLLAGGAATQAEVAAEAGYFDQSHLTHSLRRALGVVPSQIRVAEHS